MIYLSSDLHLGHHNILFYAPERARRWGDKYVNQLLEEYLKTRDRMLLKEGMRDCHSSICDATQNMNDALIMNWNARIEPKTVVYFLGDFAMGNSDDWSNFLRRLNGKIHFIAGTHDSKLIKQDYFHDRVESCQSYLEVKYQKQFMVLSHYAFYVWNASHRGSWNLFGHSHGSLDSWSRDRKSMDVGVDAMYANYAPISFDEIKNIMQDRDVKFVDGHRDRERNHQ